MTEGSCIQAKLELVHNVQVAVLELSPVCAHLQTIAGSLVVVEVSSWLGNVALSAWLTAHRHLPPCSHQY